MLWRILSAPVIGLIYIFSIGSVFWLDLAYALSAGMLIPYLLARIF